MRAARGDRGGADTTGFGFRRRGWRFRCTRQRRPRCTRTRPSAPSALWSAGSWVRGSGDGGSSGNCDDGVGCITDNTLGCSGGAYGYSCSCGDKPGATGPQLPCSTPRANAGEDDYCCFIDPSGFGPTCEPDDTLTSVCPDADAYGYRCDTGDQPSTLDTSLHCSDPTADPDGVHTDYCCTYG